MAQICYRTHYVSEKSMLLEHLIHVQSQPWLMQCREKTPHRDARLYLFFPLQTYLYAE